MNLLLYHASEILISKLCLFNVIFYTNWLTARC